VDVITREYTVERTDGYEGASLTWYDGGYWCKNHDPVIKSWQQYVLWWDANEWAANHKRRLRRRRP
jgi:hypothetical protein